MTLQELIDKIEQQHFALVGESDKSVVQKYADITGICDISAIVAEDGVSFKDDLSEATVNHLNWHIPGRNLGVVVKEDDDTDKIVVADEESLIDAFSELSGTEAQIKLTSSITVNKVLTISGAETNATVDLGKNTLTTVKDAMTNPYGDGITIGQATAVIKNGKIDNSASAPDGAAIMVKAGSNVTLDNVDIVTNGFPVYVNGAAEVNIKSGEYVANNTTAAVYAAKAGATVIIEGGRFKSENYTGKNYCLNLKDGVDATIEVRGGEFINFDPSHSQGEPGHDYNFVAEGYKVVSKQSGDDIIYSVVKA